MDQTFSNNNREQLQTQHQQSIMAHEYHHHATLTNDKTITVKGNSGQGYVQTTARHHVFINNVHHHKTNIEQKHTIAWHWYSNNIIQ